MQSEEVVATPVELESLRSRIEAIQSPTERIPSYNDRMKNLRQFKIMIEHNLNLIGAALKADLNQPDPTPHLTDCLGEVEYMLANLSTLMTPKSLTSEVSLVNFPATAKLVPEPLGTVLVVGTWNFPFHAALGPVPGALAAGNRVVVKPGTLSQNSSRLIAQLIDEYMDPRHVICVQGGIEVMTPLLNDFVWEHIFFTGSTRLGKIVMTAAAQHLTPVTLELGGKSPCIVTASADIPLAARRIAWGKWAVNAGQVCIAPDHVLVDASVADELITELGRCISNFFESSSDQYCRIISKSHVNRLKKIIATDAAYQTPIPEILTLEDELMVPPHLFDFQTDWQAFNNSACMKEEIFGPLLPIIRYTHLEEVQTYLKQSVKTPLAFYVFTKKDYWLASTVAAGAVVVNDTGMHIAETSLPFGGIGTSGMGAYHGKLSFDSLTHYKPILFKSGWLDIPFRYPPFTEIGQQIVKFLLWLARKNVTPLRIGKIGFIIAVAYHLLRRR